MENTVEARWKSDPRHLHRPSWAVNRTQKGWSDSRYRNSKGEASLIGLEKRLSDGSILTRQVHIPIKGSRKGRGTYWRWPHQKR